MIQILSQKSLRNPSNAFCHFKRKLPSAPVMIPFSNMKCRSIIELMGEFWNLSMKAAPSTPSLQWNHICNPFEVGVEDVSKSPPWSWKSDYPGAIYFRAQPLGILHICVVSAGKLCSIINNITFRLEAINSRKYVIRNWKNRFSQSGSCLTLYIAQTTPQMNTKTVENHNHWNIFKSWIALDLHPKKAIKLAEYELCIASLCARFCQLLPLPLLGRGKR